MAPGTTHDGHDYEPLSLELQPIDTRDPWTQHSRSICGSDSEITPRFDNSHASTVSSDAEDLPAEERNLVRHHPVMLYDPPYAKSDEVSDVPILSQDTEAQLSPFSPHTSSDALQNRVHDVSSPGQERSSQAPMEHPVGFPARELELSPDHQLADTEDSPERKPSRQRQSKFKSWKVGITMGAVMSTAVLCTNIILILWAMSAFEHDGKVGTAHEGECETVSAWSFWLHVVINGLSSVLLSASNYAMQCAVSPTRLECDRAHARGKWLDVGIPSVRNLFYISYQRRFIWALLALSSLPIHLLYNSAVFESLDANTYNKVHTTPMYLEKNASQLDGNPYTMSIHDIYIADPSSFEYLTPQACVETYAKAFVSGHRNVILVTDNLETRDKLVIFDESRVLDQLGIERGSGAIQYHWWVETEHMLLM